MKKDFDKKDENTESKKSSKIFLVLGVIFGLLGVSSVVFIPTIVMRNNSPFITFPIIVPCVFVFMALSGSFLFIYRKNVTKSALNGLSTTFDPSTIDTMTVKRENTNTKTKKSHCDDCGARRPAGSKTCPYCGHHFED